jgi:xanthine dehydrogenase YagS FAD-binding subunit
MNPFQYAEAASASDAVAAVAADPAAVFLAGGTTLIDLMKEGVSEPALLVDVNRLPLREIKAGPDSVEVGALVRMTELARHPEVATRFPVLAQALLAGASPQLRNVATIAGNMLQRTRCPYFRDVAEPCNKREPGSGCGAMDGVNRSHAILGTSPHCIATHPSDMTTALMVLDAEVVTERRGGGRRIPFAELHVAPGEHPERETVLKHGELITALVLRDAPEARRSRCTKVRERASYAYALASAAVAMRVEDGAIRAARVGLGGVATRPWRSREAEAALTGRPARTETYREAAEAALAGAQPRRDNAYKVELAKRTLLRTLEDVGALA